MEVLLPLLLTLPPGAAALVAVSLGLAVGITSCMFMAAYFFQSPQLTAMAREEFAALVFTALILFFWFGMDTVLNALTTNLVLSVLPPGLNAVVSAAPGAAGSTLATSHFQLALASLKILEARLLEQYKSLYLFEALIGFLSTISFPIMAPFPAVNIVSFSLAPFTGLVLLSNAHTMVVEAIGYLITVVWAKEFILLFSRDAVPLLILPIGLVLRAVPFYRKTGSSVIAVAFALYFVLPFSMIFSSYLIFDVYKPVDFTYMPATASYFGDMTADQAKEKVQSAEHAGEDIRKHFQTGDLIDQGMSQSNECSGNPIMHAMCGLENLGKATYNGVKGAFETIFNIWKFMMGMTGDFALTLFSNPVLPASSSSGLYYFLIREVLTVSPFVILVMVTVVLEIIFTITMYRNISVLLGGEAELVGVTKVI
jgi:hypothetical protein